MQYRSLSLPCPVKRIWFISWLTSVAVKDTWTFLSLLKDLREPVVHHGWGVRSGTRWPYLLGTQGPGRETEAVQENNCNLTWRNRVPWWSPGRLLCVKEVPEWNMFEGDFGCSTIGNNYILSFKLTVSVGISMRIWIVVFWFDDKGKFFTIQPLDFILCMLIRCMFFSSVSKIGHNICGTQRKIKMLVPLLRNY